MREPFSSVASEPLAGRALRPSGVHWLHAARPVAELRYPRGSLVLVGGIPGAGKTTLLGRAAVRSAGQVRRLDPERWRARLARHLPAWLPYRVWRPLVHLLHYLGVIRALAGGDDLLVHEAATRPSVRRWLARRARRHGRPAHLVILDVDLAAARQGQVARGRLVRRGPLRRHWARWRAFRRGLLDPRSDAALAAREGWASCVLLDREAANRLAGFVFEPGGGT